MKVSEPYLLLNTSTTRICFADQGGCGDSITEGERTIYYGEFAFHDECWFQRRNRELARQRR